MNKKPLTIKNTGDLKNLKEEVKRKKVIAPIVIGEIIIKDILNTGTNIIATKTVDKNKFKNIIKNKIKNKMN